MTILEADLGHNNNNNIVYNYADHVLLIADDLHSRKGYIGGRPDLNLR